VYCVRPHHRAVFLKLSFNFLQAEAELRVAQSDFDRHAEVTRLLLEGLGSSHVRVLFPFLDVWNSDVSEFLLSNLSN
jgi:hypothetical protein